LEKRKSLISLPLLLLLILLLFSCPCVRGAYDWLKPGSYAIYDLAMDGLVRLNETCLVLIGVFPNETSVARYGFSVLEVDGDYALLKVSFNESTVLPILFNMSSLSCMVWVDLETRDLVDRDTGEVWGKCPFWVYPWEANTSVTAFYDFFGAKITWDNVTKWADSAARVGVYSPSMSFSTPIGYFNEFDFIVADYGIGASPPLMNLENVLAFYQGKIHTEAGSYGFSPSIQHFYHVENGLLLIADSLYADDILAKNFGIIILNGMLNNVKPEYSRERVGWLMGPLVIYDTNILRGSDRPTVGGGGSGFPWYIPLSIAAVALLPLIYYVYLRRLPERHSLSSSSGG
jgi:hypothetical protein